MRAWYLDEPSKMLTPSQVHDLLGIVTYHATCNEDGLARLDAIKKAKNCHGEDTLFIHPDNDDHQSMLKKFWREHKHPDEEIRYFERGTGYFDVRDAHDSWVRIELMDRDLFVLPANTYHRFQPKSPEAKSSEKLSATPRAKDKKGSGQSKSQRTPPPKVQGRSPAPGSPHPKRATSTVQPPCNDRATSRLPKTAASAPTAYHSPRGSRRSTLSRSFRRALPPLPDSRSRFGGPYTTTYRNRFGTYTRVSSSPPLRPRLVVPRSPPLRTPAPISPISRGRLGLTSSQRRLYQISCATASSAAKQRPPVRPRLPPPPVPPPPPPPPPPKKVPTFASPTQSWVAKQTRPLIEISVPPPRTVSPRSGSPRLQKSSSSVTTASSRLSAKTAASSCKTLPTSTSPSPTSVRRGETFTRKTTSTSPQVKVTLNRSRTFSKEEPGPAVTRRDGSPRVPKSKSPTPAEGARRPSPTIKVTPPVPPPPPPPPSSPKARSIKSNAVRTASKTCSPVTKASTEKLSSSPGSGDEHEEKDDAEEDESSVLVPNGVPKTTKIHSTKTTKVSTETPNALPSATTTPKKLRSITVQTSDV
ncbi:1,2-dihydroxy-3-keto-5-methylthiopentene dioxygenase-like [Ixodes scapularis]